METNLERYKSDLKKLISLGDTLHSIIQYECYPTEFTKQAKKHLSDSEYNEFEEKLKPFAEIYQKWYSESQTVIRQILPDRFLDFVRLYEKPKGRKQITYENYVIEDYLQG